MPGACNPFVAAPDTNTLELLISSINCSELIGGVWKNSYASSNKIPLPDSSDSSISSCNSSSFLVIPVGLQGLLNNINFRLLFSFPIY